MQGMRNYHIHADGQACYCSHLQERFPWIPIHDRYYVFCGRGSDKTGNGL